jgi:hypothetical protein
MKHPDPYLGLLCIAFMSICLAVGIYRCHIYPATEKRKWRLDLEEGVSDRTRKRRQIEEALAGETDGILRFVRQIGIECENDRLKLSAALAEYPADLVGELLAELPRLQNCPDHSEAMLRSIASFVHEHYHPISQREVVEGLTRAKDTIGQGVKQLLDDLVAQEAIYASN